MNPISLRLICRTSRCFPLTNTITHDITSTTQVRMAVPRLDSTPSMPILPKIAVKLANTAEPSAKSSQRPPGPFGKRQPKDQVGGPVAAEDLLRGHAVPPGDGGGKGPAQGVWVVDRLLHAFGGGPPDPLGHPQGV